MTEEQLKEIRGLIGNGVPPEDGDLAEAWDRLQSVSAVALEVQRARLAELRSRPSSFTVDGDYSENWSATITSLERQVAELQTAVSIENHPSTNTVLVGRFERVGRSR